MKPFEVDFMAPSDVWISIEAQSEKDREEWERVRALAFVYARYSMNGCKAKTPHNFWRFPWDKKAASSIKEIMEQHALKKARLQQKQQLNNKTDGNS